MIKLRIAQKAELEWINECYDKVDFIHSNFDNETIAIAEFDNQKAGLGRLVTICEKHLELGGIYVLEAFRNKGIAKELVKFLLEHVKPFQAVYCIPFNHLLPFYHQSGFITCTNNEFVPKNLLEKYNWCKEKYTHSTSLLVLERSNVCESLKTRL